MSERSYLFVSLDFCDSLDLLLDLDHSQWYLAVVLGGWDRLEYIVGFVGDLLSLFLLLLHSHPLLAYRSSLNLNLRVNWGNDRLRNLGNLGFDLLFDLLSDFIDVFLVNLALDWLHFFHLGSLARVDNYSIAEGGVTNNLTTARGALCHGFSMEGVMMTFDTSLALSEAGFRMLSRGGKFCLIDLECGTLL